MKNSRRIERYGSSFGIGHHNQEVSNLLLDDKANLVSTMLVPAPNAAASQRRMFQARECTVIFSRCYCINFML